MSAVCQLVLHQQTTHLRPIEHVELATEPLAAAAASPYHGRYSAVWPGVRTLQG